MYDGRETEPQFGGFPFGGLGGFAVGSGGLGIGGLRGGLIGGGGGIGATSSIGPLLTLEAVFGTGFTARDIADAILVLEQGQTTPEFEGGVVIVTRGLPSATGAAGMVIFNTITGIFQILGANGSVQGSGRTPDEAAANLPPGTSLDTFGLEPFSAKGKAPTAPLPFVGAPVPQGTGPGFPGPAGGGEFGELLRTILGALGQLRDRPRPVGLEPVAIGGTVNVPVVPGSTSDPRGTLRPTAAAFVPKPPPPPPRAPERPTATQAGANIVRVVIDFLLRRRQAEALRDFQRRQLEILAAAAALRRQQMGFGQSGFAASLPAVGGFLGGALGGLAETGLELLLKQLSGDVTTSLPAFPTFPQLPGQQPAFPPAPGIPGLQGGGPFGSACPPLFRDRGSVLSVSPVPWFPMQAPNGKWFFFGHLGKPTFSKLKSPRRHHHHARKR